MYTDCGAESTESKKKDKRSKKIAELKKKIKSGKYKVDSKALAEILSEKLKI